MNDFVQDMENLLNAYDCNWDDYLALRKQFIEKYSLSVEKLQGIRVEELKDFNSKILQAELKNQKLQKEIDAAKKYIEESYKADKEDNKLLDLIIEAVAKLKSDNETLKKALTESEEKYQKQMDRFLNSEMNESARSHCESQLKLLFPAHKAYEALAAIGGDDE